MSAYTCTLFTNTGFNTINIPDSPALVNSMSHIDVPALDLNQERFLPMVRVRATWAQVKDADYCKVGDFYYTISDIQMTSQDVAELSLIPDYITSAGGPAALTILDGLTDRVHVADDTFGIYSADDPYMAPAYDMDIDSFSLDGAGLGSSTTFIETTLSLDSLGYNYDNNSLSAYTAWDPNDPDLERNVVVPVAEYLEASTSYQTEIGTTTKNLKNIKKQGLFTLTDVDTTLVGKGINVARSLGIEDCISGQFEIPDAMFTATYFSGFVTNIKGLTHDDTIATLPFIYGTANNNRVWYGSYSKYTLVSTAGNTLSANAEEIYDGNANSPVVRRIVDPRRSGKPYYRFMPLNGNSGNMDFFRGCVAGMPWDNVPMVLREKSGNLLDRTDYVSSLARRDLADKHHTQEAVQQVAAAGIGGIASGLGGIVDPMHAGQAISGVVGSMASIGSTMLADKRYQETQNLERQLEKANFQIQQAVNIPEVKFPLTPDIMNETLHNGFMVFRTRYKTADISRIDKILTAFGYKHTKVLEASDFTNRTRFNYVAGSISVGNLPRWWANGIAAQVAGGVRVWHVKPNPSYYASNPIVTTP